MEMFMQKIKRPFAVDGVQADEPFDRAAIADAEPSLIEVSDFGEFVADSFIGSDAVKMATLDHERPGRDQGGHLGIVEGAPQIEFKDLVFAVPSVTVRA